MLAETAGDARKWNLGTRFAASVEDCSIWAARMTVVTISLVVRAIENELDQSWLIPTKLSGSHLMMYECLRKTTHYAQNSACPMDSDHCKVIR